MSKYYISECVDCGLPCLGNSCPYYKVAHFYCDTCGASSEDTDMYNFSNEDICNDCYEKKVKEILQDIEEWYEKNEYSDDFLNQYAQCRGYTNIHNFCIENNIDYYDLL